ncbi:Flagellar motor rotation protein MotB [Dissulfuribacter thermophilus]|uniref:Flagellar motor rotation protein MotB n=1 Tax=Dissulfuribacter thermophilus TaxID=1156395 RepID=A0A1B9F6C9_9BACT|nr:flagellar motor protein MotB [Dissulfuribacter thermophilus]OCC15472.1 Flagellar motor rotation protein MotB [Dissulfuribacter thermophilus]
MGKKCECPPGAPKWMVTFGDLMSLLLCFFVLLLSFSTMDPAMFKEVSGSLRNAFGVQKSEITYEIPKGIDIVSREFNPVFTVDIILEKIKSAIKLELIKGEIEIEALNDRVILRFNDELTFPPGSAELIPSAKPKLDKIRKIIEEVPGEVLVAGHTDNIPIQSNKYPSNWHLSAARAATVVTYLLKDGTIAPSRLAAIGYGPSRPRLPNDSPENRKKNRRVEIIFMQPQNPEEFDVKPITGGPLKDQEIMPAPVSIQ